MKQNENKASQSKQQKQCRSSRNGGSAQSLSFEDRQKIAEREARRSGYESIEYVCDVDGKSVFCSIYDLKEACIIGLPEFIEVNYDGTVRSIQGFDYMDLIEDDLDAAELIKQCHVFNGEDQCPSDLTEWKQYIWKYERFWVDSTINNDSDLQAFVQDYIDAGLKDFQSDDQTAIELKAIFYNRHCKHNETTDPEGFMQWYVDIYQQTSKQQTR